MTNEVVGNLHYDTNPITSIDISKSNKILVSGSLTGDVILWDYLSGERISIMNKYKDENIWMKIKGVIFVKFSPCGN